MKSSVQNKLISKKRSKLKIKKNLKKIFFVKNLVKSHLLKKLDLNFLGKSKSTKSNFIKNDHLEEDAEIRHIIEQNELQNSISNKSLCEAKFVEYDMAYEKSIVKINQIKREMLENIEKLIERDANLNDLQHKACDLNVNICDLEMTSKKVKKSFFKKRYFSIGIAFIFLAILIILIIVFFYEKFNKVQ